MSKSAEEILDKYYSPKMHWQSVNRQNVLKAMEEYRLLTKEPSIKKEPKDHIPDTGNMIGDQELKETIQNALYATKHFLTYQCQELAEGIFQYLKDAGFTINKISSLKQ